MEYTYEQKSILANMIDRLSDKHVLKQIIKIIKQNENAKLIQDNNGFICRKFEELNNDTYIQINKLIDDYNQNNNNDSETIKELEISSNSDKKLRRSQKKFISTIQHDSRFNK